MKQVVNSATGERIVFLRTAAETRGEVLEMEDFWPQLDHRTPRHVHPEMEERWEVMQGRVGFCIGAMEKVVGPGEIVVAPAGTPHWAWNADDSEVRLRIEMRPALRWQEFVERLFALSEADPAEQQIGAVDALLAEFSREVGPLPI
jgi:quercetin dioxygenase-like cupin family protein